MEASGWAWGWEDQARHFGGKVEKGQTQATASLGGVAGHYFAAKNPEEASTAALPARALFPGSSDAPKPTPVGQRPVKSDAEIQQEAAKRRAMERRRRGRSSTVLTAENANAETPNYGGSAGSPGTQTTLGGV